MLHRTGPGKVDIDSRYAGRGMIKALLHNFDVDGDTVKPEHVAFLQSKVVPLLQGDHGHIWMQGSASKTGTNQYNMDLSKRRVNKIASVLRTHGVLDRQMQLDAVGEELAQAHVMEEELDRAVALVVLPMARESPPPPKKIPPLPPVSPATDNSRIIMPGLDVGYEIPLPETPQICPISSPVCISLSGKITVKGHLKSRGSHSTVSIDKDKVKVKFTEGFSKFQPSFEVKPGQWGKVQIEWTSNRVSFGFSLNRDLSKPFTFKWILKQPLKFLDFKLTDDITFSGSIQPQLDVNFHPNKKWPGWAPTARAGWQATRRLAPIVRGVWVADEVGTATVFAVGATATAAAVVLVAWVGFGLYKIGQASEHGRLLAVRYAFASGYAGVLAELTSDHPDIRREDMLLWLSIKWEENLSKLSRLYVGETVGSERVDVNDLVLMGKAAAAQEVDKYIKLHGPTAWDVVKKSHSKYGFSVSDRKRHYLDLLNRQIDVGDNILRVPIL